MVGVWVSDLWGLNNQWFKRPEDLHGDAKFQPFEDVSPIKNGSFSIAILVFRRVTIDKWENTQKVFKEPCLHPWDMLKVLNITSQTSLTPNSLENEDIPSKMLELQDDVLPFKMMGLEDDPSKMVPTILRGRIPSFSSGEYPSPNLRRFGIWKIRHSPPAKMWVVLNRWRYAQNLHHIFETKLLKNEAVSAPCRNDHHNIDSKEEDHKAHDCGACCA